MDNPANRYAAVSTTFSQVVLPGSSRSVNASSAERSLLLGVIASHLNILDARDNDSRTLRHKSLLWDQVTKKFNSLSALPRSRHQIQTLYKNMKAKAKKYQMRLMEARIENAPHSIPEPDPVSELLLQLLAGENEQRRIHLQQTALNISGELSLALSNGEEEQIVSQPTFCISPTVSYGSEEGNHEFKEEPICSDNQTSLENSLLGEESPMLRTSFHSANQNNYPLFPSNGTGDFPQTTSRLDRYDERGDDTPTLFNEPVNKRPCLSPYDNPCNNQQKTQDQTKNAYQFIQTFNDNLNQLKYTDAHFPSTFPGSKQCCCPNLHTELIAMAKKEHELRLVLAEDEKRFKAEEHRERMKLLKLEQEVKRRNLKEPENCPPTLGNGDKGSQNSNDSVSLALDELEAICNENNISVKKSGV